MINQTKKTPVFNWLALLLGFLLITALPSPGRSQEWHEGSGVVKLANITPEEARKQAFEKAMADALAKAKLEITGVKALHQTVDETAGIYDNFIQFTSSRTCGLIVDIDTLFDKPELQRVPGSEPVLIYRAKIRARVETGTTDPDPEFSLMMSLNQDTYRNGEEMVISLSASRDCYISIFNLYSNDSLRIVYPNSEMTDNYLNKSDILTIPPPDAYWGMPVELGFGRNNDDEALMAVATRQDVPFNMKEITYQKGLTSKGEALLVINRWLADIKADKRTQAWVFYGIVR